MVSCLIEEDILLSSLRDLELHQVFIEILLMWLIRIKKIVNEILLMWLILTSERNKVQLT